MVLSKLLYRSYPVRSGQVSEAGKSTDATAKEAILPDATDRNKGWIRNLPLIDIDLWWLIAFA